MDRMIYLLLVDEKRISSHVVLGRGLVYDDSYLPMAIIDFDTDRELHSLE